MKPCLRLVLALCMAFVPVASSAQQAKQAAHRAHPQAAVAGDEQSGIKFDGTWKITVRNSDGTVASRREFKNALVGKRLLASWLLGGESLGMWVSFSASGQLCGQSGCFVYDSRFGLPQQGNNPAIVQNVTAFPTLQITPVTGGIKLTGSFPVNAPGGSTITNVFTIVDGRRDNVTQRGILAGGQLTSAALTPAQPVNDRQFVQFEYTLLIQ